MNRTVSGCAIMLLVEGVTGIAAQSYATDATLLAELRTSWPPAGAPDAPAGENDGYVTIDLATLEPAAAIKLTDRFAVALAADRDGEPGVYHVVPVIRWGYVGWRRAVPGDGLSAFVAGVPMASERPIGTDQTNVSVVVGERAILKWFRRVGPGPSRATTLIAHLDAVGFSGIPAPLGALTWQSPAGVELTLAQGDAFLPGARDGWEWCVERVPDDVSIGTALGELVGGLHRALATPSAVIGDPVAAAGGAEAQGWQAHALAALDEAVGAEPSIASLGAAMRGPLESLPVGGGHVVQPIHGDLHVGQVLEWPGGLAVIDFDGNPAIGGDANAIRQPRERDIAQMLMSIDHVGRIVDHRSGWTRTPEVEAWIAATRANCLAAVGPVNETLLDAFEVEQECRELIYASRFLPRWSYAPIATLRARFGT